MLVMDSEYEVAITLLTPFQDDGNTLATANASRANSVLALRSLQFVDKVCGYTGTTSSEGMAEGNGTAAHVCLGPVETDLLFDREKLDGKGFVDLDDVHVFQGEPCSL